MEKTTRYQYKSFNSDNNNVAVAYIRVSTKSQEEKGFSLEIQKEKAISYAHENGLILTEDMIFEESKPASKTTNDNFDIADNIHEKLKSRPILSKIIELASERKFSHLIVYTRDRLTRNMQDFITLKTFFAKSSICVHYSRPGEFSKIEDTKINNFLELILASVAELEANTIGIRVKGGNRSCIKNSYWAGGKIPFGYSPAPAPDSKKNSTLQTNTFEQRIIEEIFNLYTHAGYGYRKISKIMNEQYPFITWTKSKIEAIIKNETYTGYITWDRRGGRRNPGKHLEHDKSPFIETACIIPSQQWNDAVALRYKKYELKDSKYYSTPFLLRSKLVCGICGSIMDCKNYGKGKKSVYRCPTSNEKGISELIAEKELLEQHFTDQLKKFFDYKNIDELWNLYKSEFDKKKSSDFMLKKTIIKNLDEINVIRKKLNFILSQSIEEELKTRLFEQSVILNKKEQNYKEQLSRIDHSLNQSFESKDDFDRSIMNVLESFSTFEDYRKRLLIDILIDNIILEIKPEAPDQLFLKIIINPPKNILS